MSKTIFHMLSFDIGNSRHLSIIDTDPTHSLLISSGDNHPIAPTQTVNNNEFLLKIR